MYEVYKLILFFQFSFEKKINYIPIKQIDFVVIPNSNFIKLVDLSHEFRKFSLPILNTRRHHYRYRYCISLTKAYFGFESINRSNKNTCRVFSITDQVICSEKSGSTQESIQNFSKDKYSKFYISPFYLNFHNYHK